MIAIAVVAAVAAWLLIDGGDSGDKDQSDAAQATVMSTDELHELPGQVGHVVYWAGEEPEVDYEVTRTAGNTFIRYLTGGAEAGDPRAAFLTVGTYPFAHAYREAKRRAGQKHVVSVPAAKGAAAFYSKRNPTSVYLAFPGSNFQIEVYDPDPERARALVRSGDIVPLP